MKVTFHNLESLVNLLLDNLRPQHSWHAAQGGRGKHSTDAADCVARSSALGSRHRGPLPGARHSTTAWKHRRKAGLPLSTGAVRRATAVATVGALSGV